MPPRPVSSLPPIHPAEMEQMVARAGLKLNPGQMADLVLAWRQVAELAASIPRDRPLVDDLAYAFRLPAPAPEAARARPTAAAPKRAAARPARGPKRAVKPRR